MGPQAFFGVVWLFEQELHRAKSLLKIKNNNNKKILNLFRGSYVLYICTFVTKRNFREREKKERKKDKRTSK